MDAPPLRRGRRKDRNCRRKNAAGGTRSARRRRRKSQAGRMDGPAGAAMQTRSCRRADAGGATRRPGDPATRRPGDPATRRPGDHYTVGTLSGACQPRIAHRRNGGGERGPSPVHISDHGPVPTVSRRRRPPRLQNAKYRTVIFHLLPPSSPQGKRVNRALSARDRHGAEFAGSPGPRPGEAPPRPRHPARPRRFDAMTMPHRSDQPPAVTCP